MSFDAVIIGASIAGLYSGLKLSAAGWKVCIIDRRREVGLPVRCGEATGNRTELARFVTVDESWIACDVRGLAVHVNNDAPVSRNIADCGVILHRDRFEQSLAREAAAHGAAIMLNTAVTGLDMPADRCNGVRLEGDEVVSARVVIGADGCESKVGRWAGITSVLRPAEAFSAAQYRVTSDFCNDGFLHFFVGTGTFPRGYGWVFPKSAGETSVGGGYYGPGSGRPCAREVLDVFLDRQVPGVERRHLISGCVPLAACPRMLYRGNVAVVGDAARQCNPLTAGGIMNTLEAADLLFQSLTRADAGPVEPSLRAYSRAWVRKSRIEQRFFGLVKDAFLRMSDREIAGVIGSADRMLGRGFDRSRPYSLRLLHALGLARLMLPRLVQATFGR